MRRVLETANGGYLSSTEIASRSRISEWRTKEILRSLEDDHLLVSVYLMPVGLKVYRVTERGKDVLAKAGSI